MRRDYLKNREDITLELRSTIDDMLPEDYNEKDVKSVLEKLGSPVSLANGYLDRPMHLIGPRYFDVYTTLLKMIIPIAAVIALISMVAENFIGYSGDQAVLNVIFQLIGKGIGEILKWASMYFLVDTCVCYFRKNRYRQRYRAVDDKFKNGHQMI